MTIEWEVLDEERDRRWLETEEAPIPPRRRRRWLGGVLGILLLVLLLGGGRFWWQTHQQEEELRRDLLEVMTAESRAQSFGLEEQVASLLDPDVSGVWRERYEGLFRRFPQEALDWLFPIAAEAPWRPPTSLPTIDAFWLEENGKRVEVELVWAGRRELLERRAYRLVDGAWHRTSLVEGTNEPWRTYLGAHFLFRAHEEAFEEMNGGAELLLELQGLVAHVQATWPELIVNNERLADPITITYEPQELTPLVSRDEIHNGLRLNDPTLSLPLLEMPLSPARMQQLTLATAITQLLVEDTSSLFALMPVTFDMRSFIHFLFLFPEAEAQYWTLEHEERALFQEAWREALNQEWLSPFEEPEFGDDEESMAEAKRWLLSSRLFIVQLQEEGYAEHPGDIMQAFADRPRSSFEEVFVQLMGLEKEALEEKMREYALREEGS